MSRTTGQTPAGYTDGYRVGYEVGAYGVNPDGEWVGASLYDSDRMADPAYRKGMQDGRTNRIDDEGDDHNALVEQARTAYLKAHPDEGSSTS